MPGKAGGGEGQVGLGREQGFSGQSPRPMWKQPALPRGLSTPSPLLRGWGVSRAGLRSSSGCLREALGPCGLHTVPLKPRPRGPGSGGRAAWGSAAPAMGRHLLKGEGDLPQGTCAPGATGTEVALAAG